MSSGWPHSLPGGQPCFRSSAAQEFLAPRSSCDQGVALRALPRHRLRHPPPRTCHAWRPEHVVGAGPAGRRPQALHLGHTLCPNPAGGSRGSVVCARYRRLLKNPSSQLFCVLEKIDCFLSSFRLQSKEKQKPQRARVNLFHRFPSIRVPPQNLG